MVVSFCYILSEFVFRFICNGRDNVWEGRRRSHQSGLVVVLILRTGGTLGGPGVESPNGPGAVHCPH